MSELKLEVGKSYRNRRGDVVKIVNYNPFKRQWNYIGHNDSSYNEDGSWFAPGEAETADLIEEVVEERQQEPAPPSETELLLRRVVGAAADALDAELAAAKEVLTDE